MILLYHSFHDIHAFPHLCLLLISSALILLDLRHFHHIIAPMIFILFRTLFSALKSRRALALENLALRHQLEVLQRNAKRPRLTNRDRTLWVIPSRFWPNWRKPLTIVQPDTVVQ